MIDRACISLNAKCNLKCVYCHFADKKNNENSLKNDFNCEEILLFCKNLEDYIVSMGATSFKLGIVGSGEPLLSFRELKTIVDYFSESKVSNVIKMYVISNGTILSDDVVKYFYDKKNLIELNISLDGDPKINIKLRGMFPVFDNYEKVFGNKPKINAVVTRETIANQDRILRFFVENGFKHINFSKIFGTEDKNYTITNAEYESFLNKANEHGITSRQNGIVEKYDCAKYGRLCGVGKTNVFVTKTGVYPCGRFMDLEEYRICDWDVDFHTIEKLIGKFRPCPRGECFFEYNKVGLK